VNSLFKHLGPIWIGLFALIYCHDYFWNCLRELMKTAYGMFMNCFQLIFTISPRWLIKGPFRLAYLSMSTGINICDTVFENLW